MVERFTITAAEQDPWVDVDANGQWVRYADYAAEREQWINYTTDLQRIIEALCGNRKLPQPVSSARHHYNMAERALAERAGGVNEDALRALAQAYDREDAAQRGEPDPWNLDDPGDIGDSDTWVSERLACARAAAEAFLSALEPSAARELALEEALRKMVALYESEYDADLPFKRPDWLVAALSSTDHADDLAVDRFAIAMKQKLAKKREEGRGGWENKDECSAEYLSYSLIQHIWKGDPVDVANFAMMLQQRGERVVIDSETSSIIPRHPADAGKVEGDGWLPIESAPKDGTEILAWRKDCGQFIASYTSCSAFPMSEAELDLLDEETLFKEGWFTQWPQALRLEGSEAPTHWRPLPAAPASEGAE